VVTDQVISPVIGLWNWTGRQPTGAVRSSYPPGVKAGLRIGIGFKIAPSMVLEEHWNPVLDLFIPFWRAGFLIYTPVDDILCSCYIYSVELA
jgi:hypothetical protein